MGVSRRFLNLIVDSRKPGAKSLRRIDVTRHRFFDATPPPHPPPDAGNHRNDNNKNAAAAALKMEKLPLPRPAFSFQPTSTNKKSILHFFPLARREVLCLDQSGRAFVFDGDTRCVVTMPSLHKPKSEPISVFVPSTTDDGDDGSGSIFIMESLPRPELGSGPGELSRLSDQFEALVYRKATNTSCSSCQCQLLPPPPFVRDRKYLRSHPEISATALVGGGSQICISVERVGTYCLDTLSHTWSHVGEWTLPFLGKVVYIPELKLWFGLSAKYPNHLAAADLSTMDSQPELTKVWNELDAPRGWWDSLEPQLVNLGGGRFCIARFFYHRVPTGYYDDQFAEDHFAVLTGVEVVPCDQSGNGSNGTLELEMIRKSTIHLSTGGSMIRAVF